MNKAFYKCATCAYHKVDLEKEKCICLLEKLNPDDSKMAYKMLPPSWLKKGQVISGGYLIGKVFHYHKWICYYHQKFLNCPGYKKDET